MQNAAAATSQAPPGKCERPALHAAGRQLRQVLKQAPVHSLFHLFHLPGCLPVTCRWYLHISYPLFFNSVPFDPVWTPQVKVVIQIECE